MSWAPQSSSALVVQALRRGDHEPVPQQQLRVRLHAVVVEHLLARPVAPAHPQLAGVLAAAAAALPELPARLDRHVVVPDVKERQQNGEVVHPDALGEGLGRRRREHEAGPEAPAREDAVRPLVQLHSCSADKVPFLLGVVQFQQGRDVLVLPLHVAPDLLQPDLDKGASAQLAFSSGCGRAWMYGHQNESLPRRYSLTRNKRPTTCGGVLETSSGWKQPCETALRYDSERDVGRLTTVSQAGRACPSLTRNEKPVTGSSWTSRWLFKTAPWLEAHWTKVAIRGSAAIGDVVLSKICTFALQHEGSRAHSTDSK
ncbi:unnamed protein product [Clonostachys rhizophaga]|uniref:Uncharacterized protein n=1 Tax=Clonostachys rhizophaga TaxID=160324 RepID=A0A9N9YF08_9HYPO|nr:unnamed protein product [Clonostachys rhizophaga]